IGNRKTSNPPTLIQIATDKSCLLFHFSLKNTKLPEAISHLFLDSSITKYSIDIRVDTRKISQISRIKPVKWIDLSDLAKFDAGIKNPRAKNYYDYHGKISL